MSSGQILDTEKYKYDRMKVRDKSGKVRYSANNGDSIARAMVGMVKEDLIVVMKKNGLEEKLSKHTRGKSPGHFRMILGQALRGMVGRGEQVVIRGQQINTLKQRVSLPSGLSEEKITPRTAPKRTRKKKAA